MVVMMMYTQAERAWRKRKQKWMLMMLLRKIVNRIKTPSSSRIDPSYLHIYYDEITGNDGVDDQEGEDVDDER